MSKTWISSQDLALADGDSLVIQEELHLFFSSWKARLCSKAGKWQM